MRSEKIGKALKTGTAFELVVRDIVAAMNKSFKVSQGKWVIGPDGKRDCDVLIEGPLGKVLIECKEYKKPVGIRFLDALHSKKNDLGMRGALICSNSGFTKGAQNKAKRLGIGLIGVLKNGDQRIKFKVKDKIYVRQVKVLSFNVKIEKLETKQFDSPLESLKFKGKPLVNWVYLQINELIISNPIVNGDFVVNQRLSRPLKFESEDGYFFGKSIQFQVSLSGRWTVQEIEINSTQAIYHWLTKTLYTSPGMNQLSYKDVNLDYGKPIIQPPKAFFEKYINLKDGIKLDSIIVIYGVPDFNPIPSIKKFVIADDLNLKIPKLTKSHIKSDKNYQVPSKYQTSA